LSYFRQFTAAGKGGCVTQHTDDYLGKSAQTTTQILQVDPAQGLSEDEVVKRQQRYGYNEIEEHEESLWHRIFCRFWGSVRLQPLYFPGKQIFC
jgi:magnesium-transporting ATPase (P-type)